MSDFEDEMDVDAPAVDNSITFGGDQKKGKRSAANLPVEAEDSLPWWGRTFATPLAASKHLIG
jgi:replication factor C subunit 3/5